MRDSASWPTPFGILLHPRAYAAALYTAVSLAAGILAFAFVTTGLSLSAGMMPLLIGPVVALAFFFGVRVLGRAEQGVLSLVTGEAPEAPLVVLPEADTKLRRAWKVIADAGTWKALAFLALRLPLGIAGFTAIVTGTATGAALFAAPVLRFFNGPVWIELPYSTHQLGYAGTFLCTALGFLILVATLHGALLFARVHGWLGRKLLG